MVMATVTIRKLNDATVESLKARAKAAGRSMEEEVRRIITEQVNPTTSSPEKPSERFRRLRQELFGNRVLPSSLGVLREIREEDPTSSSTEAP